MRIFRKRCNFSLFASYLRKIAIISFCIVLTSCAEQKNQENTSTPKASQSALTNKVDNSQLEKPNFTKLDKYIDALVSNDKAMISVAIRKDGELVYSKQAGYASVSEQVLLNKETKLQMGSISKVYTAVLIMQLVESGKLTLEQTLSDFFPDIVNAETITIKDLLSHRSGLYNFTNDPQYIEYMESPKSKSQMLKIIKTYEANELPNTNFEYSNTNYVLLGYIIEDILDLSYAEALNTYITAPLGLHNTYFADPIDTDDNEAYSYRFLGEWQKTTETDMSIPHAAGAIAATPEDVSAFMYALFNEQLLTKDSLRKMKVKGEYGLGLMSFPFYGKTGYGHSGSIDGFVSNAVYFDDQNISSTVAVNGINYEFNDILIAVLSAAYNMDFAIPNFEPISEEILSKIDYEALTGEYSSEQLPLDISVFVKDRILQAQASGQGAFPISAESENVFVFKPAGISMEFKPEENSFILNQGGGRYLYNKQP